MNLTPPNDAPRPSALPERRAAFCAPGFTLIEVLLALAICAVVLVAINAVFSTAVKLRDKTTATVEEALPLAQALETIRHDLKSAAGPRGFLAGDFKCDAQSMGTTMGLSASGSGLDFFSTGGVITEGAPWGDVQEVIYQLMPATSRSQAAGMDLVRYVNRNLLASVPTAPEPQVLLSDVQSVEFECYDGIEWRTSWDTSLTDTNLPAAVRITIHQAVARDEAASLPEPVEFIVPLTTLTLTNLTQSSSMTGGTP
jgi:general secretion pathway protein J